MRDTLTKHGIPDTNVVAAVSFLNDADESVLNAFNHEFGLSPDEDDTLKVARFAATAVLNGAADVGAVKAFVSKRIIGIMPVLNAPVMVIGVPVVDTPEVTVTEVVEVSFDPTAPVVVHGRKGRRKNGKSEFCKAVKVIEAQPEGVTRKTILDAIVAEGVKASSAIVYLWRYNKGERD